MDTLSGTIERVTFFNPDNGYSVIKIAPDGVYPPDAAARDGLITVVGSMPEMNPGEAAEFNGTWVQDPRWGMQFRAEMVRPIVPTSAEGLMNYLSSGIVSGIGPRTAERIVKHFGEDTLRVLNEEPERLDEIVKPSLAKKLAVAWADNQTVRQVLIFLQGYGVSSKMAQRIYDQFGSSTVQVVQNDPYVLADEVFGIGFVKADQIALNMGLAVDSPQRMRAGLAYALGQLAQDGHVYVPRPQLLEKTAELLRVQQSDTLETALQQQILNGELISDQQVTGTVEPAIYLPMFYHAEKNAAVRLRTIANTPSALTTQGTKLNWPQFLADLLRHSDVQLTDQQQGAVRAAFVNKVSVLTGGPGTGKTTTLRMVIEALASLKYRFALCSPTGRAARRLAEATGYEASTIHRLLGFAPGEGFGRDEDNPIDADVLVVDESSMVDLLLFHTLLRSLRPETHLVLVGDVDQLPSVGAGNVLRDVIDSGVAHVTRLDTIFRQADDSYIVVNAHRINNGEMPMTDNQSRDFYFFGEDDPTRVADLVVDIAQYRLPDKFGFDPINDVQVIAPMYRGPAGVTNLNDVLQRALNGDRRVAEKALNGRVFRVGDKVMQTRNNYEKDVFNGDIGRIHAIDFEGGGFEVVVDGRFLYYEWHEAEDLMHAYCISTHRSQGSEYPVVVMPLLTQHYMMLQRNLLYTAITRAKQMVVLVGTRRAVHMAVNNNKVADRFSGLVTRLQHGAAIQSKIIGFPGADRD
ncbi:MAG: ATP-dependent RecD-like DNA helicase [Anaerolineaceae bacterium]|nr:ATP-dependent RecD-like DNA helicase [Anaerolineaceae bacterium]